MFAREMRIKKRAQIAMEFLLLMMMAFIVVIALIAVLYKFSNDYSDDRNTKRLTDLGYSLQSELILADQVEPGYIREITIPNKVDELSYSINQTANDLVITYKGSDLLFPIPQVSGTFKKGTNTITKQDDGSIVIS